MTTPDPATLSWLLRKASLDVVHARRDLFYKRLRNDNRVSIVRVAVENFTEANWTRLWLADIIREHGQEGTVGT